MKLQKSDAPSREPRDAPLVKQIFKIMYADFEQATSNSEFRFFTNQ